MTNYLNLREGKFPIKLETSIEGLSDGLNLGTLKNPLNINLSIESCPLIYFLVKELSIHASLTPVKYA